MEFWRYIDACFIIWQHGEVKLLRLFEVLNSSHPSIQFTYKYSETSVNFLDVTVTSSQMGVSRENSTTNPRTIISIHWRLVVTPIMLNGA